MAVVVWELGGGGGETRNEKERDETKPCLIVLERKQRKREMMTWLAGRES